MKKFENVDFLETNEISNKLDELSGVALEQISDHIVEILRHPDRMAALRVTGSIAYWTRIRKMHLSFKIYDENPDIEKHHALVIRMKDI